MDRRDSDLSDGDSTDSLKLDNVEPPARVTMTLFDKAWYKLKDRAKDFNECRVMSSQLRQENKHLVLEKRIQLEVSSNSFFLIIGPACNLIKVSLFYILVPPGAAGCDQDPP